VNDNNANNLKRLDIKLLWDVPAVDKSKVTLRNADGSIQLNTISVDSPETNADGSAKMNADGLPIIDKVTVPQVATSGKTLYVNRASEYVDNGE